VSAPEVGQLVYSVEDGWGREDVPQLHVWRVARVTAQRLFVVEEDRPGGRPWQLTRVESEDGRVGHGGYAGAVYASAPEALRGYGQVQRDRSKQLLAEARAAERRAERAWVMAAEAQA
jgi:hypothetical protein